MADNLDDLIKTYLAGLVTIAREYGPNSWEIERYFYETLSHYPNKESAQEYKELAAGFLLVMYD